MKEKVVVSISTKKSRDLIKHFNKLEKTGESVDWDKVFEEVHEAEAQGKYQELQAISEKKR